MTWLVEWNGKEYDIDPGEFTGLELAEIKRKAGFTYRDLMTEALPSFDGDAVRALFWTVDRRTAPDLTFATYEGPPLKVFVTAFGGFPPLVEELGKAIGSAARETSGSESSANPSDGAPPIDLNA